jgi:hypothetical protein
MKKTFIISFEVPIDTDLTEFYEALKSYGTWARATEHTWAILTEERAKEVRDYLIDFLPTNSRLFVIKSGSVAAWRNLICSTEWLKKNL